MSFDVASLGVASLGAAARGAAEYAAGPIAARLDEVGYYCVDGMAIMSAQAVSAEVATVAAYPRTALIKLAKGKL